MVAKSRAGQKGFTLIELLIVIAIIGIIAAMLIPNLLDAMQKSKQKRTMADIHIMGTAMYSWLTDEVGAAAAGASATTVDLTLYGTKLAPNDGALQSSLMPQYLQEIPQLDGWKHPYDYYLKFTDPHARQVMAIRSRGRDNVAEGTTYGVTSFEPTDYDKDLVWADGFYVQWPEKPAS